MRTKTFSAHIVTKKCHVVRKTGLSTHAGHEPPASSPPPGAFIRLPPVPDAATPRFWGCLFSMSYKTKRGNVAKKSLSFHTLSLMISDYQSVTKSTVAASRHARAGTEGGAGIGSRKGRGPTQWGGPAESSVPTRAPASQTWM